MLGKAKLFLHRWNEVPPYETQCFLDDMLKKPTAKAVGSY